MLNRVELKTLDRPSKMPEMKTSKRNEDANAFATLVTFSLQKEAAAKHNISAKCRDLSEEVSSWTCLVYTTESQLMELNQCIEDGIIRCDRCLKFEFLPYDPRCPIILPHRH